MAVPMAKAPVPPEVPAVPSSAAASAVERLKPCASLSFVSVAVSDAGSAANSMELDKAGASLSSVVFPDSLSVVLFAALLVSEGEELFCAGGSPSPFSALLSKEAGVSAELSPVALVPEELSADAAVLFSAAAVPAVPVPEELSAAAAPLSLP